MFKKGAIVLIPFPFTDLSGSKVRPALIVSNNLRGGDVVVVFISSILTKKNDLDVPVNTDKTNGLKKNSVIKCSKIATLDKKIILGELGTLSRKDLGKVDKALSKIFKI